MYDKSDPRAALAPASAASSPQWTAYSPADYSRFYETEPHESGPWGRTWLTRGQNAIVAYSEVEAGAQFDRKGQVDEWVLLLPDASTSATVAAGGETKAIEGYSVTFVPPGDSTVVVNAGGRVIRLFTTQSADLAVRCANAAAHGERHQNMPPFQPWPVPPDGYKIRTYSLDVPDEPGRFGRIWRCTTFMVNFSPRRSGPGTSRNSRHTITTSSSNTRLPCGDRSSTICAGPGRRT